MKKENENKEKIDVYPKLIEVALWKRVNDDKPLLVLTGDKVANLVINNLSNSLYCTNSFYTYIDTFTDLMLTIKSSKLDKHEEKILLDENFVVFMVELKFEGLNTRLLQIPPCAKYSKYEKYTTVVEKEDCLILLVDVTKKDKENKNEE